MSSFTSSTSKHHAPVWQALFRPMLLASLALHGLVLFIPVLAEPETPVEKVEETVELTQLPPLVSLKTPAPTRPTPATPLPLAAPPIVQVPPRPQAPPPPRPSAPPAVSPASPVPVATQSVAAVEPSPVAPTPSAEDQELQDYFSQFQSDLQGVAAGETAGLSIPYYLFESPQLFFTAESLAAAEADPTLPAAPVDGVDNILWASRRRPADLLTELQSRFEGFSFNQMTDFGGGALYKLEKGSTVRYLNLIRASDRTATFVVIWNRDPNQPPSTAEAPQTPQ